MNPMSSSVVLSSWCPLRQPNLDAGNHSADSSQGDPEASGAHIHPHPHDASPLALGDFTFSDPQLLTTFWVLNNTDQPLDVRLSADIPCANAVHFQHHNESLYIPPSSHPNLLFTDVAHIQSVAVPPGAAVPVVLAVLPDPDPQRRPTSFQEVRGQVSATATVHQLDNTETSTSLDVTGRICDSVVTRDSDEDRSTLVFSRALVGQTYVKDFSIQNNSEIPTNVQIHPSNLPFLHFVDYDSAKPLAAGTLHLPSYANRRIRATFVPKHALPENEVQLELTNTRNYRNSTTVRVVTSATLVEPVDGLELSCSSELHFDDCYVGIPQSRRIRIQNTTSARAEVTLSTSDIPRPGCVYFDLVADWNSTDLLSHRLSSRKSDDQEDGQVDEPDDEPSAPSSPRDMPSHSPRLEHTHSNIAHSVPTQIQSPILSLPEISSTNSPHSPAPPVSASNTIKEAERRNRVEEISLKPGQTKTLRVWFLPGIPADSAENPLLPDGSLHQIGFKLHFRSQTVVSKTVFCQSRVCESLIKVDEPTLDLGECSIHTQRNVVVQLRNISALPAYLEVSFVSSSVTVSAKEIVVPARQTYDCLLNYVPRKVNNDYNKIITFINKRNRKNDITFHLQATVVDRNRVTLHALFYRIMSPLVTNEIDFGSAVEARPAVQPFRVRNMTSKPIKLLFEPPPGMQLHIPYDKAQSPGTSAEDQQPPSLDPQPNNEVEELVGLLKVPVAPAFFSDNHSEHSWVESQLLPMNHLHRAVSKGLIRRSTEVWLEGDEERVVFSTFAPISVKRFIRMRNVQATLLVHLAEYDLDILNSYVKTELRVNPAEADDIFLPPSSQIPPREVSVVCKICKSELTLDQQQMNFGPVSTDDRKEKVLVVHNRSEANLLFSVNKTQTVASGDVQFQTDRVLRMIRPFDSKQLPFVFAPSFPGEFSETLTVANLLDARDVHEVKIKACVFRVQKFHFGQKNLSNFGKVMFDRRSSHVLYLSLENPTYKLRRFSLRVGKIGSEQRNPLPALDVLFSVTEDCGYREQLNRGVVGVRAKTTVTIAVQVVAKSTKTPCVQPLFFAITCYETKNTDAVQSVECVAEPVAIQPTAIGGELQRSSSSAVAAPTFTRGSFRVERRSFDVGIVLPGLTGSCKLPIQNLYESDLEYSLRVVGGGSGWVSLNPKRGSVAPRDTAVVDIALTAFDEKASRAEILVTLWPKCSPKQVQTVDIDVFSAAASVPQLSIFPLNQFGELDFGVGSVDPSKRFAIVKLVTIENITEKALLATVSSNLAAQVSFFSNKDLTLELLSGDCFRIDSSKTTRLWVGIAPRLPSSHLRSGAMTIMEGGITFSVSSGPTSRVTIKFKARVGTSMIFVKPQILDLGTVKSLPAELRGQFSVINGSAGMNTNFRLSVASKRLRTTSISGTLSSKSSSTRQIAVACTSFGFYTERIMVHNVRSPAAGTHVDVCWFADSGVIWCAGTEKDTKKSIETTEPLSVYLHRSSTGSWATSETTELTVTSKLTDRKLATRLLIPMCNANALEAFVGPGRGVAFTPSSKCGMLEQCGQKLALYGRCEAQIKLIGRAPKREFTKDEQNDLENTRRVSHHFFFALASVPKDGSSVTPASVLKVLKVPVIYCVSKVMVKPVNVGFLGVRTEWNKIRAPLVLENPTALPLTCGIDRDELPVALEGPSDVGWDVPAFGSLFVLFYIDPRKLLDRPPGHLEFVVNIKNRMNTVSGGDTWRIQGFLSTPCIDIDRVSTTKQGELFIVVPPVTIPSQQDVSASFRVRNTTGNSSLRVQSEYISATNGPWGDILDVAISEPSCAVGPGESHALRVLVSGHSGGCRPSAVNKAFAELETQTDCFTAVGKVRISVAGAGESGYPSRDVTIRVQPRKGPSLSCSRNSLTFKSTSADTDAKEEILTVRNVWLATPAYFSTQVAGVPDGVFLDVFPGSGSIPPDGSRRVTIGIRRDPAVISAVSFAGVVEFLEQDEGGDPGQPSKIALSVVIQADLSDCRTDDPEDSVSTGHLDSKAVIGADLTSGAQAAKKVINPANSSLLSDTNPPKLLVKGCKALSGRSLQYEIDVGQLTLGATPTERTLVLESTNADVPMEYGVQHMGHRQSASKTADDRPSWITLNRNGGVLDGTRPSHTLVVKFRPYALDVYSSYLLIENKADPTDIKIVSLGMEVVADGSHKEKVSGYFTLLAGGREQGDTAIHLPVTMIGHVYRNVSFLIRNHAEVSMEFTLTHDLAEAARSQMCFSLTNDMLRRINTITVPSKESRRIFLYYRPAIEVDDESQLAASHNCLGEFRLPRKIKLQVNCRLVKDYQETIVMTTNCRVPQMEVSMNRLDFSVETGGDSPWDLHEPRSRQIQFKNLQSEPLEYCVRNNMKFFSVEDAHGKHQILGSNSEHCLAVRPSELLLKERWQYLVQERHVEEHFTIYNRLFPQEYFWVRVRLCVGDSPEFSALAHRRGVTSGLEELVGSLIQQFGRFWSQQKLRTTDDMVFTSRRPTSGDLGNEPAQGAEKWLQLLVEVGRCAEYGALLMEMRYVTDELVYHELDDRSEGVAGLARMLFGYIFSHNVFLTWSLLKRTAAASNINPSCLAGATEFLEPWVAQLQHFLSFVPDKTSQFKTLCELEKALCSKQV